MKSTNELPEGGGETDPKKEVPIERLAQWVRNAYDFRDRDAMERALEKIQSQYNAK